MGCRRYGGIMIEQVRRRMMMRGSAKPYDAEVEWIQGSPGYRINADVNVSNNGYKIMTRIKVPSNNVVDVFEKDTGLGQAMNLWYVNFENNGFAFNVNTTYKYNAVDTNIINVIIDMVVSSNTISLQWNNKTKIVTTASPSSATGTIYILSRPTRQESIRLYSFRLFAPDGSIIRDFIPVRKGNTGYLYDRVSDSLFDNMYTTGYAIIGPDKTT